MDGSIIGGGGGGGGGGGIVGSEQGVQGEEIRVKGGDAEVVELRGCGGEVGSVCERGWVLPGGLGCIVCVGRGEGGGLGGEWW